MKNRLLQPGIFVRFSIIILIFSTSLSLRASQKSFHSLIPKPVSVKIHGDSMTVSENLAVCYNPEDLAIKPVAQYLISLLKPATGFDIKEIPASDTPKSNFILLETGADSKKLGQEGYELTISKDKIKLTANSAEGIFRGIQTLRQLLPPAIELKETQPVSWKIPTCHILDYPAYSYRGSMLDVARHFFPVEVVKRYIDLIAAYKMNVLHLHLADDQGWRIEIKSWPLLTEIGGSTQVGGGKGGFFTQEDYQEIVKYASGRFITIIPEIDMPGHTNAALASYAELNADNQKRDLYTGTKVGFSTLATKKEITYQFIDDVFRELAAITPGPYLHAGGDESHVTKKEDYIPFIEKVQQIINAHGKQMIGWDETTQSALNSTSVAQHWSKAENAKRGVTKGVMLIMSPSAKAYLDIKYHPKTKLGLNWAGYIEVNTAYNWNPATIVPGIGKASVLGIEAPLWSETVTNIKDIEFMLFPRLPGYAEIGWSPSEGLNWEDYKVRLGNQAERFQRMGINYYPSETVPWKKN